MPGTSSYHSRFTHWLRLLLLVLVCLFVKVGWGQGVSITSPEDPGPTSANPIPIDIHFQGPVNSLTPSDFVASNGTIGNVQRQQPQFSNTNNDITLEEFSVTGGFISIASNPASYIKNAVISITQLNDSDILYLTYGNGVRRLNYQSLQKSETLIKGEDLQSPLDIEADSPQTGQHLFLADKDAQQVNVYDNSTVMVESIKSRRAESTNDIGPTGLVTDEAGNLYVTVAYTGSVDVNYDRVEVYNKTGDFVTEFPEPGSGTVLEGPYRVAVDKQGRVYVCDGGGSTDYGRILVFEADADNYKLIHTIEGATDHIGAPGSIVVDEYGYIYVVDYQQDITFNGIFNDPLQLLSAYQKVRDTRYSINVYDPQFNFVTSFNDNLNLPIDLEIDHCGNILVNNLKMSGEVPSFLFGVDINFNFQLKTFQREDNFTADLIPENEGLVEADISGDIFKCEPQPQGHFEIEYNSSIKFDNCPSEDITQFNDPGECGAIVTFETPTASSESGEVQVKRTEGPASGERFPVGTTTVIFTATDAQNITATCSFDVTIIDGEAPIIQCKDPITVTAEPGNDYAIVNFTEPAVVDNCAALVAQTGGPSPGSQFPIGTKTITYTATDQGNNTDVCSFDVIVKPADVAPEFSNCPSDISRDADQGRCGAVVNFDSPTASDENGNVEVKRTDSGPASGEEFPVGTTTVVFEATDAQNNTSICEFNIKISDKQAPLIACPGSKILSPNQNGDYLIPNYTSRIISDNCDDVSAVTITQNPAEGTAVTSDTTVEITAVDSSGNTSETCSFTVQLEAQPTPPVADCNSFELPLDVNGQATITAEEVYGGNDSSLLLSINKESFDCSNLGLNPVKLTVTDPATDLTDECTATITVVDRTAPAIACSGSKILSPNKNGEYLIPNYTSGIISDNCDDVSVVTITQDPAEGTAVTSDTTVEITAEDSSGNTSETCSFSVQLEAQATAPKAHCHDLIPTLDANGQVSITAQQVYNAEPGNLKLSIDRENFDCSNLGPNPVKLTVTDPATGLSDSCTATVTIVDETAPTITCPYDQTENYDPAQGFVLPDYSSFAAAADNCSVTSITQQPAVGTNISQDTQITLTAKDAMGNEKSCTFMVLLTQEEVLQITCPGDMTASLNENCLFEVPDYRDMASVNIASAEISQSPEPGDMISESTAVKLMAAKDGQTDICTFNLELRDDIDPVARCVGNYELTLNASGSATISADELDDGSSDNCGTTSLSLNKTDFTTDDIGENQVVLTVTDAAGNSDNCTTTVTVKENTSAPGYQCVGQFTLPLDESGSASLEIGDLYEGNIAASNFSLDRSDFSCEDLGQQVVRLSYFEKGALKSYCDIEVFVIDNTPPEVRTRDLTIDLDQNGTASISAEDIDAGSTDNCGGELSFSLSKSNFSCKNTGSNEVTLTVSDENGNSSSGIASVYVNAAPGICSQLPAPEVKYLYIYPNPNNGQFQIAVPSDLKVKEVSLYDNRGRFIGGKSFADDAVDYEVDLPGLQDAIYNLVIQTGRRGKITRRIIVRN